jgi:hypothetical protein
MNVFFDSEYWPVNLRWSRPVRCEPGRRIRLPPAAWGQGGFYRFERRHHLRGSTEMLRIGLGYKNVGWRVYNGYSRATLERWRRRGVLYVSYAILELEGRRRKKRYEDVEHFLVYYASPRHNVHKVRYIPSSWYHVTNLGDRGVLPREIIFPVARIVG